MMKNANTTSAGPADADTPLPVIGIVGAGRIGLGWAVWYHYRGYRVVLTSTEPDPGTILAAKIDAAAEPMAILGLAPNTAADAVTIVPAIADVAAAADIVHECVPEQLELKRDVFRQLDAAAGPDTLLLSSCSSLLMTDIQAGFDGAARMATAHPLEPAEYMPLVEIAPGKATSRATMDRVDAAMEASGRSVLRMKTEMEVLIANRLHTAVLREAFWMIGQREATPDQIDQAVTRGIGRRYAISGPLFNMDIAGGEAGIGGMLESFSTEDLPDFMRRVIVRHFERVRKVRGSSERERDRNLALAHVLAAIAEAPDPHSA